MLLFASIDLDELASLPSFYVPTVSYDREKIAFYWDKTGQIELYVMDASPGAEPRQLTNGEAPRTPRAAPMWTRDDEYLIFPRDADGNEQHDLWRVHVETGDVEQLTDNPTAQEYPVEAAPDNKRLLVASNLNGQMNNYLLDLDTREYTQISDYQFPVMGGSWSPDGKYIVYSTNETSDLKNSDVYIMDADGGNKRKIFSVNTGSEESVSDWSSDGRLIAVSSDYSGGNRVGVYDVETESMRWLTPESDTVYPGKFSPDGSRLLMMKNEHSTISTIVYDVQTGEEVPIEMPPGLSFGALWLDEDRFVVNMSTDTTRPELRDYHIDTGESHLILESEYGSIDPTVFTSLDYVSFESADGLEIHAMLYCPREMEPGKKYPALVEIHGGPTAQFFRAFNPYAQILADNGYIIIQPNVRGSTGYGVEFRDMNLNDWGGGDLEDVVAAADYLKQLPEVDNDRIGIWGGSYGGYMTYMAVTKKPDLWKAGVAVVGITDLKLLHDSSMDHFKYYLQQQMGDPEENVDLWHDRSAIHFAEQMQSHLLILHGVNDPRCPLEQAQVFRDRLVEVGKTEGEDFEYVELGAQGHGSADITQKTETYKRLLDYFDRNL
jgi:dipeptidyl aminopeptidase/acylaminoacyl peptidase